MTNSSGKNKFRLVNGVLLVDKPLGKTSNAVLQTVKRFYQASKAGHTGCLDPLATGMLPICFGEATKFSHGLFEADKCYETTVRLGEQTTTGDVEGELVATTPTDHLSIEKIQSTIHGFIGVYTQMPSIYSALKHNGRPLYEYARKGIEVPKKVRQVEIKKLDIHAISKRQGYLEVDLTVLCTKGTYIRTLAEDIGQALGVGAHVRRLHRNYTVGFEQFKMYSLDEILNGDFNESQQRLLAVDCMLMHLPQLILEPLSVLAIRRGQTCQENALEEGLYRLYDQEGVFCGLVEKLQIGVIKAKRLTQYMGET